MEGSRRKSGREVMSLRKDACCHAFVPALVWLGSRGISALPSLVQNIGATPALRELRSILHPFYVVSALWDARKL